MSLITNRNFAIASAVIYLSAGVLGFLVTGFDDFLGNTDEKLIILGLNPAHNVVHLVLGTAWLAAATSERSARVANVAIGAGLLAAFVLGVLGGAQFLNIDGAAEPDNYLHLIYGALSVFVGARAAATISPSRTA
ncbi:MAG: DUF4383 domain-containing protein [Nocardiaceae bacterium]|nr:DUF4383 domain-containing protein [Nocardiaceae bacterium]